MMKKKILYSLTLILLLSISFLILTRNISADLPTISDDEVGIHFDPPSKSHNARNYVLYGKWLTDEWSPYIHSPIYTLSQAVVFRLFGIGYSQMRYGSILLTIISLYFIYEIVSKSAGNIWGLICVCCGAISYIVMMFGRSGLLEPYVSFFALSSVLSLQNSYANAELNHDSSIKKSVFWLYLSGLLSAFTFLSKPLAIYVVVSYSIITVVRPPLQKKWIRTSALAFAFTPIVASYIFFEAIHLDFVRRETEFWITKDRGYNFALNWLRQPFFIYFSKWSYLILILGVFSFYFIHLIFIRKKIESKNISLLFLSLIIFSGLQINAFMNYRPVRYYYPLIIFSLTAAGIVSSRIYRWIIQPDKNNLNGIVKSIFWIVNAFLIIKFAVIDIIRFRMKVWGNLSHYSRLWISSGIALLLYILIRFFGSKFSTFLSKMPALLRKVFVIVIGLYFFGTYLDQNQRFVVDYLENPQYSMRNFSRYFGNNFADSTIAGTTPLFAVMENSHKALKVTMYNLNWDVMRKTPPTHIITMKRLIHAKQYEKKFPEIMSKAKLLDIVNLCGFEFLFFAVNPAPLNYSGKYLQEKNVISVIITNPDNHSPQHSGIVLICKDSVNETYAFVKRVTVPVSAEKEILFDLPSKDIIKADIYAIEPQKWTYPRSLAAYGSKLIWDDKEWGLECRQFKKEKINKDKEFGAIEWRDNIGGNNFLIAIALKGKLNEGGKINISWGTENGIRATEIVTPDMLDENALKDFVILGNNTEETEGIFRVEFYGGGNIYSGCVAMFSIEEKYLEENSLWHKTISFENKEY